MAEREQIEGSNDTDVLVAAARGLVIPRGDDRVDLADVEVGIPASVQLQPGAERRQVEALGLDGLRCHEARVGALTDDVRPVGRGEGRDRDAQRAPGGPTSRVQIARTAFCGSEASSIVTTPSASTRRTPRRLCQSSTRSGSSIRAGSGATDCGVVAWVKPPSELGERMSRNGASIAVSSGRGGRGLGLRGRKAGSNRRTRCPKPSVPAPSSTPLRLIARSRAAGRARCAGRWRRQSVRGPGGACGASRASGGEEHESEGDLARRSPRGSVTASTSSPIVGRREPRHGRRAAGSGATRS